MLTNLIERNASTSDIFQNYGAIDGIFNLKEANDALR